MNKKEYRKKFTQIRKASKSEEKDKCISERFLSDEQVVSADTVLLFASFGSETDTYSTAEKLIKSGIPVAFPRCGKNRNMTFHVVSSLLQLKEGMYGIPEPEESLPRPVITEKTVCMVPGLAFTEGGTRLGYGGGYYDVFISANPFIHTIAVSYESMITDFIPVSELDMKIKKIITEERTIICNE